MLPESPDGLLPLLLLLELSWVVCVITVPASLSILAALTPDIIASPKVIMSSRISALVAEIFLSLLVPDLPDVSLLLFLYVFI